METEIKKLCTICFKMLVNGNFQEIGEMISNMLDTLLLKPNMDITVEASICNSCVEDLKKAFQFKSMYQNSKKMILETSSSENDANSNMGTHFLFQEDDINLRKGSKEEAMCQVCARYITNDRVSNSQDINEYINGAKEILGRHLHEMDITLSKKKVICTACFSSLKQFVDFIEKCLDAEDKINKYHLANSINNTGLVDLDNVFMFTLKQSVKTEVGDDAYHIMEVKKENIAEMGDMEISGGAHDMKMELWHHENHASQEILWLKSETYPIDPQVSEIHTSKKCLQTDNKDLLSGHEVLHRNITDTKTEHRGNVKNVVEIKMFYCDICIYKTKRKANLRAHLESHKRKAQRQLFKCDLCIFQAQFKSVLRKHMVVHTDPSQLRMFMCQICPYQTKYKGSLTGHMQKHNDEGHKCEVCGFETKYSKNLERHMMTHRDPAERPKYTCAICAFEARRKSHLSMHITVKHRRALEITKFGCELCGFEFISKSDLNRHSKTVHKDPSEIPMYSCSMCPFQTKYKDHLPRHMIIHRDASEVVTFKCEFCPFQTKYENGIKGHLLMHADITELPVFRCDFCAYETNRRQYLSRHLTTHKNQWKL